ncbi:MAG: phosphatase PAP2 family protein [Alphaproteobacteria bacterium]|nr:phosphatase PAP2 family protein [Alphaproteobacteria bacterium]
MTFVKLLPPRWFWVVFAAASLTFLLWPQLDIAAHRPFYREEEGFYLRDNPIVFFIHEAVPWITRLIVLGVVGACVWHRWQKRSLAGRQAAYLLLSLALGPGLLVNTVLKDQWGRARPSQIVEFGGDKPHTPPLVPVTNCERNCSFVSGHASVGFYFYSFAFLYPRHRRRILLGATVAGGGIGLVRMMEGGHFLSDVIFCGLAVYFVAHALHVLMFSRASG